MKVLGIETSCDDTAAAIYDSECGLEAHLQLSQVESHRPYGGVVPELAARDHVRVLMPLVEQVITDAGIKQCAINAVAYTAGPGLAGALLVGASLGRSLAWALDIPAAGIHHMEGHLLAPMLEDDPPRFPFVALLVSGGHTLLVDVRAVGQYRLLGTTLDDAVGEAFDKTAKLLGLTYPGGPAIAVAAQKGSPDRFRFPRPMTDRPGLDMSFSGLKTFAANTIRANDDSQQTKADIARAFEDAVVDTLVIKCKRALKQTAMTRLVIAGGVSANTHLREQLGATMKKLRGQVFYPRLEFCTDNGAMIAYAGLQRLKAGQHVELSAKAKPRWPLDTLPPLT